MEQQSSIEFPPEELTEMLGAIVEAIEYIETAHKAAGYDGGKNMEQLLVKLRRTTSMLGAGA